MMKENAMTVLVSRTPLLVLLVAALAAWSMPVTAQAESSELQTFVCKEAGFRVDLPPNPTEKTEQVEGKHREAGKQSEVITLESFGSDVLYRVIAIERSGPSNRSDRYVVVRDVAANLQKTVFKNAAVKQVGITQHDMSGMETSGTITAGAIEFDARFRIFYDNHQLYQVVAMGSPEALQSELTKQFMDSFQTLEKPETTPRDFVEFSSMTGKFCVVMPPNPKSGSGKAKGEDVETGIVHSNILNDLVIEASYLVLHQDHPGLDASQKNRVEQLATNLVRKITPASSLPETLEFTPVTHNGISGIELRYDDAGDEKTGGQIRILVSGHRLYAVIVWGPELILSSNRTDHFFDSFRVLKTDQVAFIR